MRRSIVLLLLTWRALGRNPLVPDVGMADPHVHIFQDRAYLYASHDFSTESTGFRMDDWWVWSSPDLVTWTKAAVQPPPAWATASENHSCWATDAAESGGRYFWYVSVGPEEVGVFSADSPHGPWTDPLGRALLPKSLGDSLQPPTSIRDPSAFREENGTHYLVFGTFEYYVARLGEDMISLAEPPRRIEVLHAFGQNGPNKTDDKPFLHKLNGLYYLSWGAFYGVGHSPYGPFAYQGTFLDPASVAADFQVAGGPTSPWYRRWIYKDRHGSFFEWHNQWYFSSNDLSHSKAQPDPNRFRDSILTYVHFRSNGSIAPLVIDAVGVGEYDAALGAIEAENYFELRGGAKRESPDGFELALTHDSSATFPNVRNVSGTALELRLSSPGGGRVTAFVNGVVAASTALPDTGGRYASVALVLGALPRTIDLTLSFAGEGGGELARLDSLRFLSSAEALV